MLQKQSTSESLFFVCMQGILNRLINYLDEQKKAGRNSDLCRMLMLHKMMNVEPISIESPKTTRKKNDFPY